MLKVLIVDNEAAIRRGLTTAINWEEQGYTIVGQAVDGVDGLEQAAALKPDIIISDIRMPGKDGLQLAEAIQQQRSGIQVILLTGYPDFTYAQKAISFGVVDYVLKPVTRDGLLEALSVARERLAEHRSHTAASYPPAQPDAENIQMQRSLFLNSLIHDSGLDEGTIRRQSEALGLPLNAYVVLRVKADLPEGTPAELDALQEEAHHLLGQALGGIPFTYIRRGSQHSYYVVHSDDSTHLLARANQAAHNADALLHCQLTIGLSDVHAGPQAMADAAWQARQAQQFASYAEDSAAVPYSEIPAADQQDMDEITTQLRLLRLAIEQRKKEDADTLLAGIFRTVRAARLPLQEVHKLSTFTVHFCVDHLFTRQGLQNLRDIPSTRQVLDSETVDEMERSLHRYVMEMLALQAGEPTDLAGSVRTVREYIDKRYPEELTLDRLSKLVHLSPSYLSKVFKREMGQNLSGYIQNVRMEKAKELLQNTSLKSYEVAEQVGIPDPVYFARMFKRATGVKPKDYRQNHAAATGRE